MTTPENELKVPILQSYPDGQKRFEQVTVEMENKQNRQTEFNRLLDQSIAQNSATLNDKFNNNHNFEPSANSSARVNNIAKRIFDQGKFAHQITSQLEKGEVVLDVNQKNGLNKLLHDVVQGNTKEFSANLENMGHLLKMNQSDRTLPIVEKIQAQIAEKLLKTLQLAR